MTLVVSKSRGITSRRTASIASMHETMDPDAAVCFVWSVSDAIHEHDLLLPRHPVSLRLVTAEAEQKLRISATLTHV